MALHLLVLGRGKTGGLVAEIARERGHHVETAGSDTHARALADSAALADVVIDFTTPAAVQTNLGQLLRLGSRVVVGTTGWYGSLETMCEQAAQHGASLLYGTNFSLGVQAFIRAAALLATALPGCAMRIEETHHVTKKDAPSGTALTLQAAVADQCGVLPGIESHRVGDAAGLHELTLRSTEETLTIRHEATSRRSFALGAVRAAEWLASQPAGVYDFAQVSSHL